MAVVAAHAMAGAELFRRRENYHCAVTGGTLRPSIVTILENDRRSPALVMARGAGPEGGDFL